MLIQLRFLLCGLCSFLLFMPVVFANPAHQEENAIRHQLLQWTQKFNARDSKHICDLFAVNLRYDYRGISTHDYQALCKQLHHSLSDTTKRYHYSPDIQEIIVSGDLAMVRLVWTLKIDSDGKHIVSRERGMDVFKKLQGKEWQIIRYIGYEEP